MTVVNKIALFTFQSTPSRRGRHGVSLTMAHSSSFQSTPSRRGRRMDLRLTMAQRLVSIHALAKRATIALFQDRIVILVSIHALAKRATLATFFADGRDEFQSTPSRRGRHETTRRQRVEHACFNPRPREEGDSGAVAIPAHSMFQSTPSRRGRP